jgi:hypothetical protein
MEEDKPDNILGTIKPEKMPPGRGMTDSMRGDVVIHSRPSHLSIFRSGEGVSSSYTAVSSVAAQQSQKDAILSAQPRFQLLDEAVLYACAKDDQPVGPRINVDDIPETTLKALSNYELERRSRNRERIWWLIGIALTAIATWLFT